MKEKNDITDNQLRQLLKQSSKEAPENPWFVRKVMNRLPEKGYRQHTWVLWCIYGFVAVVCCVGWGLFVMNADLLRMVDDAKQGRLSDSLMQLMGLTVVTAAVVWQFISAQLHSDHP